MDCEAESHFSSIRVSTWEENAHRSSVDKTWRVECINSCRTTEIEGGILTKFIQPKVEAPGDFPGRTGVTRKLTLLELRTSGQVSRRLTMLFARSSSLVRNSSVWGFRRYVRMDIICRGNNGARKHS